MGLTTAQYSQCIADLFSAVADVPGVQSAKFPAVACYGDPDYWLGGLLLAFDALPVVLGSPDNDKQRQGTIADLQLNVPPAAAVRCWLGGRTTTPSDQKRRSG